MSTTVAAPTVAAAKAQHQQHHQQRHRWGKRLRPLVAASIGCYGAAIADGSEYRGDYGSSIGWLELKAWHKERLEVLAGAKGIDFVLFETVPCLAEVRAILSLLQARGRETTDGSCCSTVMDLDIFVASTCSIFFFLLAFVHLVSIFFLFSCVGRTLCSPSPSLEAKTCGACWMWLGRNICSV